MRSNGARWPRYVLLALILAIFLAGQYLQRNTGWADNGDFRRVNQLFTDRPIGFETNRTEPGTPEHELRYGNYWLPVWNFRWGIPSLYSAFSSAIPLWLPGAAANALFVSDSELYLVVLSLFPRLLIGMSLCLLALFVSRDPKQTAVWGVFFILPLTLAVNTANYGAYLNSFYQEAGSFAYFILLVTWALVGRALSPARFEWIGLLLMVLLTTAKASNAYVALLFLPVFFDLRALAKRTAVLLLVIAVSLTSMGFTVKFVGDRSSVNLYHSLFLGVLLSSQDPGQRLAEIGITDPDALDCRVSGFTGQGAACMEKYSEYLSYGTIARVIWNEPGILYQHAVLLAGVMQRTEIGRGRYEYGYTDPYPPMLTNGWAIVKDAYFPHNQPFYAFLAVELLATVYLRRRYREFARPTTLIFALLAACVADMWVAILGDGVSDLAKHMFMANLAFDVSALLIITLLALALFRTVRPAQTASIRTGKAETP